MARCKHLNRQGEQCGGLQIANSEFCFAHTPGLDQERFEARRKGGLANRKIVLPEAAPDAVLRSPADVQLLLAETINLVRKGRLDARIGNAVGYLAMIFLRSGEVSELEARIAALEGLAKEKKHHGRVT